MRAVRCPTLRQCTAHGDIRRTSMTPKPRPGSRPGPLAKAVRTSPRSRLVGDACHFEPVVWQQVATTGTTC
eukprot:939692-Rhodomonas_salina.1